MKREKALRLQGLSLFIHFSPSACVVAHFACAGFGFNGDVISSVAYF
jgi:hypothetical protein